MTPKEMKQLLTVFLIFWPLPVRAAIKKATFEQQVEIIVLIERARNAVDYKKGDYKKEVDCGRSRNPVYCEAKKEKIKLEEAMGISHDKWGRPWWGTTTEDLKKIAGKWWRPSQDKRDEYAEAVKIYQKGVDKSAAYYKQAINLTLDYYNIGPKPEWSRGNVVNGPPWARKNFMVWDPRFSMKPKPNEKEVGPDAFKVLPGFIRDDGAIIIRDGAFVNHLDEPDPGYLAAVLAHEAMHHLDFLTPEDELDIRNEPWREVIHRWKLLRDEEVYEFTAHDWKQEFKNVVWQNDLADSWNEKMLLGKDPYVDVELFRAIEITKKRRDEIDRQVERDLKLFTRVEESSHGSLDDELERVRAGAQSGFIRYLSNNDLRSIIGSWKKVRELEADAAKKKRALLNAEAVSAIRSCDFEPIWNRFGRQYLQGFRKAVYGSNIHTFAPGMTFDQVKVSVLFAWSCLSVNDGVEVMKACNDGLDVANENWNKKGFKEKMAHGTELWATVQGRNLTIQGVQAWMTLSFM